MDATTRTLQALEAALVRLHPDDAKDAAQAVLDAVQAGRVPGLVVTP